ncbi:uncharacterized protein BBOV_IV011990 [Babesia bovis T2Bo]|uniref:Uncharacterized protein n=1 Tax=Babesia bovis TaxID=5865 RepID=A7ASN2_BABBO|nr:uncharacterized protein BBOV_IV011990 [Babesia bovis T2Bo]EDO07551.1 hypothetical protein BBOV_IV011990 [Babesia bovis T2Bo]|eukprot:XP_001611119.1 hypothetical protein [Babesia bovis T2Bo]
MSALERRGSSSSGECVVERIYSANDANEQPQPPKRQYTPVATVRRAVDEQNINQRIKHSDERKQWTAIKALMKKINSLSDSLGDAGWGPPYEIPTKPTRKGPTMGLHFGHAKRLENCWLIMQTPDSMERYSFYGKLMQHTSCAPYAITNVTYGHVVGIGRCVLCGTQCGKVVIYKMEDFERVLVLDTLDYYSEEQQPRPEVPESDNDEDSVRAPTMFEINSIKLVKTFDEYARTLIIGNQLGHILIVDLPSMKLKNVIYYLGDDGAHGVKTLPSNTDYDIEVVSEDEYGDPKQQLMFKLPVKRDQHVTYISAMRVQPVINDVWVGYGDGTFAVFEIASGRCKKYVSADIMERGGASSGVEIDPRWQRVTSIHFSSMLEIALIVYGNVRVDVWDCRSYEMLKSVPVGVLTCDSSLISSMRLFDGFEKTCLLFVGSMEGSLIIRKIERNSSNEITMSLVLNLLYDIKYGPSNDRKKDGNDLEYADFRGAPITCIYPLLSHNAVIVGNACGAMVAAWNIRRAIKEA